MSRVSVTEVWEVRTVAGAFVKWSRAEVAGSGIRFVPFVVFCLSQDAPSRLGLIHFRNAAYDFGGGTGKCHAQCEASGE